MKIITYILFFFLFSIQGCKADAVLGGDRERIRVTFVKKIANKEWYKLSAIQIKEKLRDNCAQDKKFKLLLNCDENIGIREFNIIGESAYEPLTQIIFNDSVGCLEMIEAIKSTLGAPKEMSVGKCDATWELGKNVKHKNTRIFASIYAPPSGKKIELNIGSEQGP